MVEKSCYDIWDSAWEQKKKWYCHLNENMPSDGGKNTDKKRARMDVMMVMVKPLWFLTEQEIEH